MTTPETLGDDNFQTLPQDLSDQEAQEVTFTIESTKGEGEELLSPEKVKEIKEMINKRILKIKDYAKSLEGIQGWNRAEELLDNLGNDIMNMCDDKTINLLYFMIFYIGNTLGNMDNGRPVPEIPEEKMMGIAKEIISFINKLSKLIEKYANKIINMFDLGLKNNFKDIPEPMKSHFIGKKEKIGVLVKNLGRWEDVCKKLGELLSITINNNDSNIEIEQISDDLSKELETLLDNQPCTLIELGEDLLDVFICLPFDMDLKLLELQDKIKNTNKGKVWGGERGNIVFDLETSTIKSWGDNKVNVEEFTENSMKLKGLDLDLTLEEGMWLANFKNRLKYTYGDQKVEHTRGIKSLFYTYYVGNTLIIDRKTLERFCPMCKSDLVREKIKDWLNK